MHNGWYELANYLFSEQYVIIGISIIIIGSYLIILRKQYSSLIDPFFLTTITSAFAFSTGICTFYYGIFVDEDLFYFFVLSELAFLFGLTRIKRTPAKLRCQVGITDVQITSFWIFSIVFCLVSLLNIFISGLPILGPSLDSRLSFYENGHGIFQTVASSIMPAACLLAFFTAHKKKLKRYKLTATLVFILSLIQQLGTGSKSGVLLFVFLAFFWISFIKSNEKNNIRYILVLKRIGISLVVVALICCFIVIGVGNGSNDISDSLLYFTVRLIGYGDIFPSFYGYNFYPNNIELADNFFLEIFGPLLQTFRILPYDENLIPSSIGVQIYQFLNQTNETMGPNPRHNIFGLIVFGKYGGILYSFFIGTLSSYLRNHLYKWGNYSIITCISYFMLYRFACDINTDAVLAVSTCFSSFAICGILFCVAIIVNYLERKI